MVPHSKIWATLLWVSWTVSLASFTSIWMKP